MTIEEVGVVDERERFSRSLDVVSSAAILQSIERLHREIDNLKNDMDKKFDDYWRSRERRDETLDRQIDEMRARLQMMNDRFTFGKGAMWFIGIVGALITFALSTWDKWR
jgi:DNA repair ATPase RecN